MRKYLPAVILLIACLPGMARASQSIEGTVAPLRQTTPTEQTELPDEATCSSFGLEDHSEAATICSEVRYVSTSGQWEQARQLATKLRKLWPRSAIGNFWLGQLDFKQGNYISAVRHFESALDLDPSLDLLHLNLGLCYLTIRQYKLFEERMNWVVTHNPHISLSYYYLGLYYLNNLNQLERAGQYFGQVLVLNPNDFKSRYYLGYVYELKGEIDKAIEEYQLSVKTDALQKAAFGWPYQGLARLYILKENLPEALNFAREAVSVQPKLAANHIILGKLHLQLGEISKGIEELKTAADLDPTDSTPRYWLSRAYTKLKMKSEAEREQKLFLETKAIYGNE